MDKIDLDVIINDECGQPFMEEEGNMVVLVEHVKDALKEAIRQTLVLASEKAKIVFVNAYSKEGLPYIDKQSILDVEKLIVS